MAYNILVVDDSSVMRSMILKTLRMSGISLGETFEAGNGREALDTLENHWVDLAFVDINMPVMNGEELIKAMQQDSEYKHVPVVVVSTEASEKRIRVLKELGVRFIQKPFSPEKIRDILFELLGPEVANEDG